MNNPRDDGPCEVTVTAPDMAWLRAFVRHLVDDRVVAAAHLDWMRTTYRWAGEVHESDEARARLHMWSSSVEMLVERVEQQHPYEVACVAAVPIFDGAPAYLSWISDESA